jgi:gas vesicle protein
MTYDSLFGGVVGAIAGSIIGALIAHHSQTALGNRLCDKYLAAQKQSQEEFRASLKALVEIIAACSEGLKGQLGRELNPIVKAIESLKRD